MKRNFGGKLVKRVIIAAMTAMLAVNPVLPVMAQEGKEVTVSSENSTSAGDTTGDSVSSAVEKALDDVKKHYEIVEKSYDVIDDYDTDDENDSLQEALDVIGTENDKIQDVVDKVVGDSETEGTLGSYQKDINDNIAGIKEGIESVTDEKITEALDDKEFEDEKKYDDLTQLVKDVEAAESIKDTKEYTDAEKLLEYYDAIRDVFGHPIDSEDIENLTEDEKNELGKEIGSEFVDNEQQLTLEHIKAYEQLKGIDVENIPGLDDADRKLLKTFIDKYDAIVEYYKNLGDVDTLKESAAKRVEQKRLNDEISKLIAESEVPFEKLADSINKKMEEKINSANNITSGLEDDVDNLLEDADDIKAEIESQIGDMTDKVETENKDVEVQTAIVKEALDEVTDAKTEVEDTLAAMDKAIKNDSEENVKKLEEAAKDAVDKATEAEKKANDACEQAKKELEELIKKYNEYKDYADKNKSDVEKLENEDLAELGEKITEAAAELEKAEAIKEAAEAGTKMAEAVKDVADTLDTANKNVEAAQDIYDSAKEELEALKNQLSTETLAAKIAEAEAKVKAAEEQLISAQAAKESVQKTYESVVKKAQDYYNRVDDATNGGSSDSGDGDNQNNAGESNKVVEKQDKVTKTAVEVINATSLADLGIILDEATPLAAGVDDATAVMEKAYVIDCTNKIYNFADTFINELKAAGYTQIVATHNTGIASVYDLDAVLGAISITIDPVKVESVGQEFNALKLVSGNELETLTHVILGETEVIYVFNFDKATGTYINAGAATTVEGVAALAAETDTMILYK